MAFIYGDPNTAGPFTSYQIKDVDVKAFKLTNANFATGNVDTLVGLLPADASIIGMRLWVKTQLAGNGITAATISVGTASGGTQFVNAVSAFGTAGAYSVITPISNIFQAQQLPLGADIPLWIRGGATTGTPTSGEMYLLVEYVR